MPFNSELEDFAQAFSSGYGMTKSKEERESEQLGLEAKRLEVGRLPTQYEHEDIKFGLDVDIAKNQLADAAAARERKKVTDKYEDDKHALDMQYQQGLISKQERDAAREKIDNAFTDANNALILQKGAADVNQAEYLTSEPVREQERRKGEALIGQSESAARSSDAETAGKLTENEINKLKLKEAQRQDKLHQGLLDGLQRPPPAENQPRVIGGGAQSAPEAVPADAAGAAPFEYVPPSAPAVGPVNTGSGATFPGAGATRGATLPAEAVPAEAAPGTAPAVVSDIFAGGVERKPIELTQVADDSTAVETEAGPRKPVGLLQAEDDSTAPVRQRVLDHVARGGGEKMPNGKRVLDVAGKEAVKDGLQQVIRDHGLDQDQAVDTPETEAQHQGYLGGTRAASPDTVEMAEKTVEERAGETLSQNEKTYYTLATSWLYHNGIGDAEGAKNAAASLLQHYQMAFSQYASVAQAASSNGDIDGAMEASVRAYANVPTGDELHLSWTKDHKHIIATITDMDGVTTQKQLMTPEEMGAYAMNVNPSSFVTLIAQAAGREDKEIKAAGSFAEATSGELGVDVTGWTTSQINAYRQAMTDKAKSETEASGKKLTPEQRTEISTGVKEAFEDYTKNLQGSGSNLAERLTENSDLMMNIRPITEQIAMDNPELRPELAVEAVVKMVDQAPTSAKIDGDRIKIKVEGSPEFTMNKDLYYRLADTRSKFAAPEDVTQDQYNQQLGDLRRTPEFGLGSDLRPYDPNRNQDEIVPSFTPPAAAVPAEAVPTYSPRFGNGQKLPSGAGPAPIEWIRRHVGQPAPEKSRMPSHAIGSQDRKPEIKYHRGTQPPRR